jgi:hypothetical protein
VKRLSLFVGASVCVGVGTCYHALLAVTLQDIVFVLGNLLGVRDVDVFCCGHGNFEYATTSEFLVLLLLPLVFIRDISKLVALGSFGILALLYNAGFLVGTSAVSLLVGSGHRAPPGSGHPTMAGNLGQLSIIGGMMGTALFVQSVLMNIARNHEKASSDPWIVKRDLGIAYVIAVVLYVGVGLLPAAAFGFGTDQLPQNILLIFEPTNVGALVGRVSLLIQIAIVYPIVAAISRRQFIGGLFGVPNPSWSTIACYNLSMMLFTGFVAATFPKPGSLVGYAGAFGAVLYLLWLPLLVDIRALWSQGESIAVPIVVNLFVGVLGSLMVLLQFFT